MPKPDRKVKRQMVLWVPYGPRANMTPGHQPVQLGERPWRVWSLFIVGHEAEDSPPPLPMAPVHGRGAYIESYVHDWDWKDGTLYFAARVPERGLWVLIEYDTEAQTK